MNKETLKKLSFLVVSLFVIGGMFIVLKGIQTSNSETGEAVITDGVQVVNVFAKNGYSPAVITAKADTPTILRISTNNTYDCSAALNIPALSYSKFLPTSGSSDVQILPQKPGTEILGSCSMGMYGFKIVFV